MHYTRWRRHGDVNVVKKAPIPKYRGQTKTHGMTGTRIYRIWLGMKQRCFYEKSHNFEYYGGRGISVCEKWKNSFETFFEDMKLPPTEKHSLERIDNDGNYCPENCKWATATEQMNNSRHCHYLTYQGETLTISQWTKKMGLTRSVIHARLKTGWTVDRTISTPIRRATSPKCS